MNNERLRGLADAHGPFASVYLPPGVGASAWSVMRRTLAAQHADAEVLGALDDVMLHAMPHATAAEGHALVANRDGVLVDGPPAWPTHHPVARLSDLPYLLPLVPRHSVRVPEASLVAAGGTREDVADAPDLHDRTVFDQFLFESARPEGPVAQGLGRCAAALRDGNADALVVADDILGERSVWVGGTHRDQVAEDEAELRALGMPVNRQRADEALPMAALTVGAEVLIATGGLPLVDGVGVLLRHH
jgi:hypothetical protein